MTKLALTTGRWTSMSCFALLVILWEYFYLLVEVFIEKKYCRQQKRSQSTDPSLRFILRVVSLRWHQTCTAGQSQRRPGRCGLGCCRCRSSVTALLDRQSAASVHVIPRRGGMVWNWRRRHFLRVSRRQIETILAKDVAVRLVTWSSWWPCETATVLQYHTLTLMMYYTQWVNRLYLSWSIQVLYSSSKTEFNLSTKFWFKSNLRLTVISNQTLHLLS